jgi:branched-subunit amino acid transport protein
MTWVAVLASAAAGYLLRLAGLCLPARWVSGERSRRVAELLPVALLAALVVIQTVVGGDGRLVVDARLAGVAAAVLAVAARAPFLLVVFLAASTTALVRALS